jgi:hypothetical protein
MSQVIPDDLPDDDFDELCGECGGEGYVIADCFEDTCCCANPDLEHGSIPCPQCHGDGKA